MTAAKTTVTLTLDDLATLRRLLDDEITEHYDGAGRDPETDASYLDDDDPSIVPFLNLDVRLHRAVQRCHRNADRAAAS